MGHKENYETLKNYLFAHKLVGIKKEDIQDEVRYLNYKAFEIPIKKKHNISYILFNKITLHGNWWMDFRNCNGIKQSVGVYDDEISKILDNIMTTIDER